MCSVSEFIGFIVISIFPNHSQGAIHNRLPFYRHKSGDALLLPVDEEPRQDMTSDEDTTLSPSNGNLQDVPVHPIHKSTEPIINPALSNPDFWMIAFIMSMCIFYRSQIITNC